MDRITIANLALLKGGNADNYITTFSDDTKEARAINLVYDHIVKLVLEDNPWNCATRKLKLFEEDYTINQVTYWKTNALWIAVGNAGLILTSKDGRHWKAQDSGVTENLNGVAILDITTEQAVVCGDNGKLLYSIDGDTWTAVTTSTYQNLLAVCANTTAAVICGTNGTILSYNGTAVTARNSGTTKTLTAAVCITGPIYAVGGYDGTVLTSPDLTTWTSRASGITGDITGAFPWGSEMVFVANDGTLTHASTAATWTAVTVDASKVLRGGFYDGAYAWAFGDDGALFYSSSIATWTAASFAADLENDDITAGYFTEANKLEIFITKGNSIVESTTLDGGGASPTFTERTRAFYGFEHCYRLPADFVKIQMVSNTDAYEDDVTKEYVREGSYLLTDCDEIYLKYTFLNTNVNTWDARLRECVAARLAVEISESLIGISSKVDQLTMYYDRVKKEARFNEARESFAKERGYNELIGVR